MAQYETAIPFDVDLPIWWSHEALVREEYRVGPSAWARGYENRPHTSGELLFQSFLSPRVYQYKVNWRDISNPLHEHYDRHSEWYVDPLWPRYIGVDLSSKKRPGNVIFVLAYSPVGVRHVLDIYMDKWSSPQTALKLQEAFVEHNPVLIFVENNGYQESINEWMEYAQFTCSEFVEGCHTGKAKLDPTVGLPGIDVQYSHGEWKLAIPHDVHAVDVPDPKDPNRCVCSLCVFKRDVLNTTMFDDTPDTVMAQYMAKEASRRGEPFTDLVRVVTTSGAEIRQQLRGRPGQQSVLPMSVPVGASAVEMFRSANKSTAHTRDFGRRVSQAPQMSYREQLLNGTTN